MQDFSSQRASLAQTACVSLLTIAALALCGFVLAHWTWAWFAPRPEPRAKPPVGVAGTPQAALKMFGAAARVAGSAMPTGIAVSLLGVVAASGGLPAYALLRMDGKQTVTVRVGGEIAPGLSLAEVQADRVILDRSGIRESVALPERGRPADTRLTVVKR